MISEGTTRLWQVMRQFAPACAVPGSQLRLCSCLIMFIRLNLYWLVISFCLFAPDNNFHSPALRISGLHTEVNFRQVKYL